ncbi:MAG: hypothetical protein RIQ33_422 [Bacteroidota bacterium]|jgi:hypothetical protein
MDNTVIENKINTPNPGIKWGGYAGAAYVLITYIIYSVFKDARCIFPYSYYNFIIVVVAMVIAGLEKRKSQSGYINFKSAMSATFTVAVIAMVAYGIFYFVLFNYIDTQLVSSLKTIYLINYEKIFTTLHTPQDVQEMTLANIKNNVLDITLKSVAQETFVSFIKCFFLAAIISVVIRKKQSAI